jgi:mRNA interferase MazF
VNWGDVWWAETQHAGRRPAVVLTRPETLPRLPVVLAAFATTTIRGLDTEVLLDEAEGLPRSCALNLDTPELLPKAMLVEQIGRLTPEKMVEVCRALAAAVNC